MKSTGYPLHSPVSPSLPSRASTCAIAFQLDSTYITNKQTAILIILLALPAFQPHYIVAVFTAHAYCLHLLLAPKTKSHNFLSTVPRSLKQHCLSQATRFRPFPVRAASGASWNGTDRAKMKSFIHQYSALEAGLAGTRAQSCGWYGSGTLHPGQFLGGSLPLLSPAFRRSHFRRQVSARPQRRERS